MKEFAMTQNIQRLSNKRTWICFTLFVQMYFYIHFPHFYNYVSCFYNTRI